MTKTTCIPYPASDHHLRRLRAHLFAIAGLVISGCFSSMCVAETEPAAVTHHSVLDVFPDSGVPSTAGENTCSFDYKPSGSTWHKGVSEEQVFLASVKNDDWQLGVGKGGQIYSLRGPYGESVPPQRVSSPWNDEVWQLVITGELLVDPIQQYQNGFKGEEWGKVWNATFPLMYFVHQSGIYTKGTGIDGGSVAAPFYSPCLRKRWNPETRTLEIVNWIQQARTPCVWKSGILVYTAYRDLGDGILEANKVLYNFGPETMTFLNTPWGGVRKSSLPETIISNPDGSWEDAPGVYGWTNIPSRNLVDTGGWTAWTKDAKDDASPALALVFGTDENDVSNGKRIDEAFRWGMAGTGDAAKIRDYQVAERMSHARVRSGDSWSVRWYLVSGELAHVRKKAAQLSKKSGLYRMSHDASALQPVWASEGKVTTEGEGDPWIRLQAFPVSSTFPVFLLKDKRTGEQLITSDLYALADSDPFPNPLPEDFKNREIYDNRVVFKQYEPHIGYENLLGFAYVEKPEGKAVKKLQAPEGVELHSSAENLWVLK